MWAMQLRSRSFFHSILNACPLIHHIRLRDPVARALSEWKMRYHYQMGISDVGIDVFVNEVERDINRLKRSLITTTTTTASKADTTSHDHTTSSLKHELDWTKYLEECADVDQPKAIQQFQPLVGRGMYILQLRHWLKYFPLSQIHVISCERLKHNPAATLNKIARFLEIEDSFYHQEMDFLQEEKNVGGRTFASSVKEGLVHTAAPTGNKDDNQSRENSNNMQHTSEGEKMKSKNTQGVEVPERFQQDFYSFCEPFNQELYTLLGEDFGWGSIHNKVHKEQI